MALLLRTPPQKIMKWRESQFLMWLALLVEAEADRAIESALTLSQGIWKPADLASSLITLPPPKSEAAKGLDEAAKITRMIDSGSFGSKARLERRKRRGRSTGR